VLDLSNNQLPIDTTIQTLTWGSGIYSSNVTAVPDEQWTVGVEYRMNVWPAPTVQVNCQYWNGSIWQFIDGACNYMTAEGKENDWQDGVITVFTPSGTQLIRVGCFWINSVDTRPTAPQVRQYYAKPGLPFSGSQTPKTAFSGPNVSVSETGVWSVGGTPVFLRRS